MWEAILSTSWSKANTMTISFVACAWGRDTDMPLLCIFKPSHSNGRQLPIAP